MSVVLYLYMKSNLAIQYPLKGILANSALIFICICLVSFILSLIVVLILHLVNLIARKVFKKRGFESFFKLLWMLFSAFSYLIIFAVFIAVIKY
ncbi:MAG: hypothetical protein LBH29_05820 [Elusimicrobiota bacterium]|nr:hypothetical protein [Elusimicrobiota bacterium]